MPKKSKKNKCKSNIHLENQQSDYEARLIEMLRKEAWEVKHCFTQYSFQAIAFSAAILGLVLEFQQDKPYLGFVSILIVILLLAVARMGTFKYATASRNLGYELHLQRTARLNPPRGSGWRPKMRYIGWEEAMRAWRIVQASIFRYLFKRTFLSLNKLKKKFEGNKGIYKWYLPEELASKSKKKNKKKIVYYPGSYLKVMINVFKVIIFFALLPLLAVPLLYAREIHKSQDDYPIYNYESLKSFVLEVLVSNDMLFSIQGLWFYLGIIVFFLVIFYTFVKLKLIDSRRVSVESEFLSIHSCAIVWQIVVVAHHRALIDLGADDDGKVAEYKEYTNRLTARVEELLKFFGKDRVIGDWIDGEEFNVPKKSDTQTQPQK